MNIEINKKDNAFHMEAMGSGPLSVSIDAGKKSGGNDKGTRPMELILMGLGSCSAIDLISILKKQRQHLDDLKISVKAKRDEKNIPAVFTEIHLEYELSGELEEKKVERALDLSINKYCSVSKMLATTVKINYTFKIN
ncbi:MAG: OsmC family peroxiredoxin [Calditrichaeota bacterium]|nr:MAG: OsmC family peroxiredoxin [Calditrichota bacterium]MBL1205611.1 OsmC family peroxiredoxin [Calditrichota bacterium]NOG45439.1 OsmC family protein [Calditrichota bacterium]